MEKQITDLVVVVEVLADWHLVCWEVENQATDPVVVVVEALADWHLVC